MRRRYTNMLAEAEKQRLLVERLQVAADRRLQIDQRRASRQFLADHVARREAEAQDETEALQQHLETLRNVLRTGLSRDPKVRFSKLKMTAELPRFEPQGYDSAAPAPQLEDYLPAPLPFLARIVPFLTQRYEERVNAANEDFSEAMARHEEAERRRVAALAQLQAAHLTACENAKRNAAEKNAEVDAFAAAYEAHERDAVIDYFSLVLGGDAMPDGIPSELRITYVAESRQLVVERQLPTAQAVPPQSGYRYVKKSDQLEPMKRRPAEVRSSYGDLIAQIALRTLWTISQADVAGAVSVIVLNGYVDTIDPATGNRVKPMLISVSATKEDLSAIAFDRVEPVACLRNLKALVSRNAHELEPIRPLVNFDMADHRFVDKSDVLSDLDTRPNLAELSPSEFESLMTNLFDKMGLETRLTQASRDGGVDCVAWDMRPIIGGKVIVQAKRYKNTVGVSAVRDLYGTMMNEGAAKGILVTTSGYGQSAYEFAKNKPIELVTGSNLLSMLSEYANVDAKISFPDNWKDDLLPGG